jgi:hypothetical protein
VILGDVESYTSIQDVFAALRSVFLVSEDFSESCRGEGVELVSDAIVVFGTSFVFFGLKEVV